MVILCGFREFGIISVSSKRVIVVIRCLIRLEVLLGCRREIRVLFEYLGYFVGIVNDKMIVNWKRIVGFMEVLKKNGFVVGFIFLVEVGNGLVYEEEEDECVDVNLEMGNLGIYFGNLS